jgi:serine/threonine protein kinase
LNPFGATLMAGSPLGSYKIGCAIGEGGMAQVFRATDTRLGRNVAIKVSGERFSDRFEREARAIAVLNYPNICTLYDVGPNYLVLELGEGEMLESLPAPTGCQHPGRQASRTYSGGRGNRNPRFLRHP